MALPASGAISLSQVNTELSFNASAVISLNDSAVRTLFAVPSGAISFSNGYGKSSGPVEPTWKNLKTALQATSFGTSYALNGSAYANNLYVFQTSTAGALLTSPDLITWTPYTGRWATYAPNYLVSSPTVFLALCNSGRIYRSTNGSTWTEVGSGLRATTWGSFTAATKGIWDGTKFVIAGSGGNIAYSADGLTWTYVGGLKATGWAGANPQNMRFQNGNYVVTGGSGFMAYSPNLTTWYFSEYLQYQTWGTEGVKDYAYGNGVHAIISTNPNSRLNTNTQVLNTNFGYTARSITGLIGTSVYTDQLLWYNNRFVLLSRNPFSIQSTDGVTWSYTTSTMVSAGWPLNAIVSNCQIVNGKMIAVGGQMTAIEFS